MKLYKFATPIYTTPIYTTPIWFPPTEGENIGETRQTGRARNGSGEGKERGAKRDGEGEQRGKEESGKDKDREKETGRELRCVFCVSGHLLPCRRTAACPSPCRSITSTSKPTPGDVGL